MAARSAVAKSLEQQHGRLGAARTARLRASAGLSAHEGRLLGWAFAFALLAAAISIIARIAPAWPGSLPVLGAGLLVFAMGGGVGVAIFLGLRVRPATRSNPNSAARHLESLLASAPMGIAVWDGNDHLLRANTKYTDFLELARPGLILGSPRDAIRAMGGASLASVLAPADGTIRNDRGTFSLNAIKIAGGGTIEILSDISERLSHANAQSNADALVLELKEEIEFLLTKADHFVEEAQTLETRLGQETERANVATQAKSEFLSHMSHELRTPLNAILGFSDMMRSRIFGPLGHEKYSEYADDIYESGEQLLHLISDILDVSQIQSGDVPIDRKKIDLEQTLNDCLATIRPRIYASGIALVEHIDPLPSVYADPVAVRQITMHVLSNAMKFTPTGGRISIKSEINLNEVVLIIDDTGIGIAPDIMERLDQPFAAIDQDASISGGEENGLDLGLSLARSLARLNGGTIDIQSEEGYGTTVRISFPRR